MRYFGEIGFAETRETSPGIWQEVITPRRYRGTVTTASRRYNDGETINGKLKTKLGFISQMVSYLAKRQVSPIARRAGL